MDPDPGGPKKYGSYEVRTNGSGFGSRRPKNIRILRTNGSGSRRPKTMRILRTNGSRSVSRRLKKYGSYGVRTNGSGSVSRRTKNTARSGVPWDLLQPQRQAATTRVRGCRPPPSSGISRRRVAAPGPGCDPSSPALSPTSPEMEVTKLILVKIQCCRSVMFIPDPHKRILVF